jgi:hypothetical protein
MLIQLLSDRGIAKFGTKVGINSYIDKYSLNSSWLKEFCEADDIGFFDADIELPSLRLSEGGKNFDADNAFLFYQKTKKIALYKASSDRLWSSLTHLYYWEYMKSRWNPIGQKNVDIYVLEHYWYASSGFDKRPSRNGISRLWWSAHLFADENSIEISVKRLNFLLSVDLDITQNILERRVSRTQNVRLAIVDGLIDLFDNHGECFERDKFRHLMKLIHAQSSAVPLSLMSYQKLVELVQENWLSLKSNEESNTFKESN